MLKDTGVKVQLDTMVLEVTPDKKVHCVSKEYGYQIIEAKSIVLAHGLPRAHPRCHRHPGHPPCRRVHRRCRTALCEHGRLSWWAGGC